MAKRKDLVRTIPPSLFQCIGEQDRNVVSSYDETAVDNILFLFFVDGDDDDCI
jgi:hypothetical protein